jgi:predicted RNase H-like HicB family nuclease
MASGEDAILTIGLEGAAEVNSDLGDIAVKGVAAFKALEEAADGAGEGFSAFSGGTVAVLAAIAALVAALVEFSHHQSEAVLSLDALGKAAGTSAAGIQGLHKEFSKFGITAETMDKALERTAENIEQSMAEVRRSIREAASTEEESAERIVSAELRIQNAQITAAHESENWKTKLRADAIAVADAYKNLMQVSSDMAAQSSNNMLSMRSAALSLQSAEQAASGVKDPQAEAALKVKQQQLAVDQAKQRVADAATKTLADVNDSAMAGPKAQLGYDQATAKQTEDQERSMVETLKGVTEAGNALAEAFTGLKKATEAAYDTKLRDPNEINAAISRGDKVFLDDTSISKLGPSWT